MAARSHKIGKWHPDRFLRRMRVRLLRRRRRLPYWLQSRISRRMLLRSAYLGVVCSVLFTGLVETLRYDKVVEATGAQLEQIGATFGPSLSASIWAFDETQTMLQIESIAQLPGISALTLRHEDHVHTMGPEIPAEDTLLQHFELTYLDSGQKVTVGTLDLRSDLGAVKAEFLRATILFFLGISSISMVVVASTVAVYQESVIRRLLPIARQLRNLSAADLRQIDTSNALEQPTQIHDELDELTAAVVVMRQTASKALIDLENVALQDPLTGLINRRALSMFMERRLAAGDPATDSFAVLHIDLDRFKAVNDKHGHAAGDVILQAAATAMRHKTKSTDCISRVGGDEFVIVLNDVTDQEAAGSIAARIIAAVSQPLEIDGAEVRVGASIGIAFRTPKDNSAERLLMNADIATYEAKTSGRGLYRFYAVSAREALARRLGIADEFRAALDRKEITAHFQPQVDMRNGHLMGFEALVRWEHPEKGVLAPGAFLDVVLETGMNGPLAMAVIDEVLRALKAWKDRGIDVPKIGVNLAAAQLRDNEFIHDFEHKVWDAGIASRQISVEVLESVLVEDIRDPVVDNVRELAQMGFPIELDDFGTGYSSISNLVNFDVDRIKIDRRFVAGIDHDTQQQAIFAALQGMAANLGLEIVAEGVETATECAKLAELGCSVIQGFFVAAPMDFETATTWLEERALLGSESA